MTDRLTVALVAVLILALLGQQAVCLAAPPKSPQGAGRPSFVFAGQEMSQQETQDIQQRAANDAELTADVEAGGLASLVFNLAITAASIMLTVWAFS
jgi:hypothetical protein